MMQSTGSQRVRYNLATEQQPQQGKEAEGTDSRGTWESESPRSRSFSGREREKKGIAQRREGLGESQGRSQRWVWLQSGLQGGWQEAGDFISWFHKEVDSGYRRQDLRFKEDGK